MEAHSYSRVTSTSTNLERHSYVWVFKPTQHWDFDCKSKKWTARTRVTGYVLFRFWFNLGGTLKSRQFDCDSWSFKWFINYISYPFYYWGLPQNIDKWVKKLESILFASLLKYPLQPPGLSISNCVGCCQLYMDDVQ